MLRLAALALLAFSLSLPLAADERQGQIISGNHDGRKVTRPGYLEWLTARGLMTDSNQQTVALFDTGYDDGTGPEGDHHPDLENPERLVDIWSFITSQPFAPDGRGHGTLVSGILTGDGRGTGEKDPQGFLLGTGIAPKTRIVMAQIFQPLAHGCSVFATATRVDELTAAFAWARTTADGRDKTFIANHSWAQNSNQYTEVARLFDERVIDADAKRPGAQPMTVVVAAGNAGPGDDT
ncbi:MAG TPA: S8 family serine peptidase, partial [Thermoanaerobaculia bacterium]